MSEYIKEKMLDGKVNIFNLRELILKTLVLLLLKLWVTWCNQFNFQILIQAKSLMIKDNKDNIFIELDLAL